MKQRYIALDAMRGFTLAMMILVNNPGSWSHVYPLLLHADWHGATPTDFVFPFFLFIVGSAMVFSLKSHSSLSHSARSLKIIRRTVILFAIGLFLNYYPFKVELENLRIFGVLQRIALAYCIAAFILFLPFRGRILAGAAILIVYYLIYALTGFDYSLQNNPVRAMDIALLGEAHLYQGKGLAFDPEGLLSTLPSAVNVLIGFEVTRYLTKSTQKLSSQMLLVLVAAVMILAAFALHPFEPINKSLWTGTFVFLTCGVATIFLIVLVRLENLPVIKHLHKAFAIYGQNPLFIYVLSWLWVASYYLIDINGKNIHAWIYSSLTNVLPEIQASLAFAVLHVVLFWGVAWVLHRRKIIISI